ncbi:peptide/nickel transport system ATP-binding protein [Pseudonocardia thermophila]|uniref:Peptide/nickel transport system ATP-binding protein n=1 Tax=Pseudonocardia thermophila TaxID=1848 RepID=A0A1M6XMA5_PSETH|nr:ABC transporter ATP-binding protein [Pseudonocardia thermophila]SHL06925.1 peptide/nickel transport system ATP-binding protein [Pseudonocardia thermophila]
MTAVSDVSKTGEPAANGRVAGDEVLRVRDLHVTFDVRAGRLPAVAGVDLTLRRGEVLALVGESGSGKSALSMALVGLNRGPRTTITGSVEFNGMDLVRASDRELRKVRGNGIAVVFQDALAALNPLHRAGAQVAEMITTHRAVGKDAAWNRAIELFTDVGMADPHRAVRAYPHELSGGMRQRVMIALGLANNPDVLIADEPTTALDVTIQAQVLEVLKELQREHHTSIILITHDLGVVAEVADRIAVMYAGRIVEYGTRDQVLFDPQHPYTRGLLDVVPSLTGPVTGRLSAIPGSAVTGVERPPGCAFAPRCRLAGPECEQPVELRQRGGEQGHLDACTKEDHR